MFRAKITLVAATLVVILTGIVYQTATSTLSRTTTDGVTSQVERAARLFLGHSRLQALEFTNETAQYARLEVFPKIFTQTDETARRTMAHQAVNSLNEEQIARGHDRPAALVAVVDEAGKVVARDLNINALYGEDLKARYPSVGTALSGTANKDVWTFSNRMYRVSCAPIRGADGRVVGALVVGFEESASDARALRDDFGTEVVVFLDGKIYASSFASHGKESAEELELARALFSGSQLAEPAVRDRKRTAPFRVSLHGETYVAEAAPLLGNTSHPAAGFVVLSSLDQALQMTQRTGNWILIVGLVAMLITVFASVATARRFLSPLDEIEQGVTEVINGNHDYIFEKGSPDFEGLENGLNVMIAKLLNRPEPSETGDGTMQSTMDLLGSGKVVISPQSKPEGPPGAAVTKLSPENQDLAREPDEQYHRRIYDEYVHAREQTGEGTRDLTFESFISKLKDNEATLCKKYNSRAVRFKVIIKQGQVTLKPVPLP